MDLQDRYDELDLIIREINNITSEISDKNYIEQLDLIKYEAQNEFEEVIEKLKEEQEEEEKQQDAEYWKQAIYTRN